MALINKINPFSKSNPNTGFGVAPGQLGERFVNKDGSFNIRKRGLPFFQHISIYSWILSLSRFQFVAFIVSLYLSINLVFAAAYFLLGRSEFAGLLSTT